MQTLIIKLKIQLKELLLTKEGWTGWIIANVITSLHWAIPVVIGFMTKESVWYIYAATTWAIGMSPFIPLWLFNIFIAVWLKNILLKSTGKKQKDVV
jgi:hypothetical protein